MYVRENKNLTKKKMYINDSMFRRIAENIVKISVPKPMMTSFYDKKPIKSKAEFGPWYEAQVVNTSTLLAIVFSMY